MTQICPCGQSAFSPLHVHRPVVSSGCGVHCVVTAIDSHVSSLWHTAPQPPQFAGLVSVSTHAPLQLVCPVGQLPVTQALFSQICPLAQGRPQPPQWKELLAGSAQVPPQSTYGAVQLSVHRPA